MRDTLEVDRKHLDSIIWLLQSIKEQAEDYVLHDMEERLMKIDAYSHAINVLMDKL